MSKILVIGQAPPAVNQRVPYDTTMLYEILSWVDITKEEAQNIFEFDAVYNKFPGFNSKGGHLPPSQYQMFSYWVDSLHDKITKYEKIIVLGNVAKDFIKNKLPQDKNVLFLVHPSKRNYTRIMENKDKITSQLKDFIFIPKLK